MESNFFKRNWQRLIKCLVHFIDLNGLKLSAALSYYTVFSIAPLLIVIISLAGIFFGQQAVEGRVYHQISGPVGSDAALQVQNIIGNIRKSKHGVTGGAILTAFLFLIGKFVIGLYLGNSRIGITYGTTASIVILMLWVYYSSIILYFGATFTYIYAAAKGHRIMPGNGYTH